MLINLNKYTNYSIVEISGRLDASWSKYFSDTINEYIRNGNHKIILDAKNLEYLSSAGIRCFMLIYKSLKNVSGFFCIYNASSLIKEILTTTGFNFMLADTLPDDFNAELNRVDENSNLEVFVLDESAEMFLEINHGWKSWIKPEICKIKKKCFQGNSYSLGIGCPEFAKEKLLDTLGEYLSINSYTVYQSPDENAIPDYFLPQNSYVPELQVIQSITCTGNFSHLLRFTHDEGKRVFFIQDILQIIYKTLKCDTFSFVISADIDGLVGGYLIKSLSSLPLDDNDKCLEIKDYLSFCGERSFTSHHTVLFGVASVKDEIPLLSDNGDFYLHIHSAVFPGITLPNGKIELESVLEKLFSITSPVKLLHLLNDRRPVNGIGETSLFRGAVWFAPVKRVEV